MTFGRKMRLYEKTMPPVCRQADLPPFKGGFSDGIKLLIAPGNGRR